MEAQPLITVIVPVYNVEKYLRRCLDSIIRQTYQNLEILCIDDGSIDNSGEICEQYVARDARIKVIHQENQGLSTARNKGLDTATGEYIAFVDSDDYIAADVLEQLYQSAVSSDATCVICGYNCVDSNGSILSTYSVHSVQQYSGVESLRRHYYHASGEENFVTVWGKLFCKSYFQTFDLEPGFALKIYISCHIGCYNRKKSCSSPMPDTTIHKTKTASCIRQMKLTVQDYTRMHL